MGILAVDLLLKSMLEFALADLRANPWLLDDVFSGLATDPLMRAEYGWKEVEAAKKWFLGVEIPVLLQHRVGDKPPIPCIGIAYNPGREREDRASLADDGSIEEVESGKILKIYSNFTPESYNPNTGEMVFPDGITTDVLSAGQFVVTQDGKAFKISKVKSGAKFIIAKDLQEDFTSCYIAPGSSLYNVHREQTFHQETYTVGAHAQSNPAHTMWLWQIIFYSLMRYKEVALEARGFELSTVDYSALERNQDFPVENVFSRYLNVTGVVEASWIKFRARRFDNAVIKVVICDGDGVPPPTMDFYGPDLPTWVVDDDEVEDEIGFDE